MSIELEIQNAINANLPAQVGEVLRKRLAQAEIDAEDLATFKKANNDRVMRINSLESELRMANENLNAYVAREADLVKREKAITTLELTAKFEQEKRELVGDMFRTVFQNRQVRESAVVPMQTQYWQPGCQGPNQYPTDTKHTREVTES